MYRDLTDVPLESAILSIFIKHLSQLILIQLSHFDISFFVSLFNFGTRKVINHLIRLNPFKNINPSSFFT